MKASTLNARYNNYLQTYKIFGLTPKTYNQWLAMCCRQGYFAKQ